MADLGKRYATALFEISAEQGLLAQYLDQAVLLRDALQEEECKVFINHPRVSGADKIAFFNKVFEGQIHRDLMGFLHLTVNKNREEYLLSALNQLVEMIRTHQNQTTARIISAVPLTEGQLAAMATLLTKKLSKKVDVQVLVDPSIIGGLSIQVDGFYIDRTLRYLLKDLKEEVKQSVKRGAEV